MTEFKCMILQLRTANGNYRDYYKRAITHWKLIHSKVFCSL